MPKGTWKERPGLPHSGRKSRSSGGPRAPISESIIAWGRGALVDVQGRVIGMTVLGPRRRALSIPSSTIDRTVDQLLARGHVFRGYLGAGLQPVKQERTSNGSQALAGQRGVLVVSIDANGPSARAGILVGDIVTAWTRQPIAGARAILRLLGPESIGSTVDLGLIRGGTPTALQVVIGERPVA